jgi:hypothetical protein
MKETIVDIANVAKETGELTGNLDGTENNFGLIENLEIRKNHLKLIKTCTLERII